MSDNALITVSDLERMAEIMAASSMFGKSRDQIISLMFIAQAEGIHPARAVQEYDIIKGKPAIKSQAALARFIHDGGKVEWKVRTDDEATAVFYHPSQLTPITVTWNMEKAMRLGLPQRAEKGDGPWQKQPGIMLQWRTVTEGVRVCDPACLNRMYTVEEVQDFDIPKMRDVTPAGPEPVPSAPLEPVFELHGKAVAEAENITLEREIGESAKLLGADFVASARKQITDLRDYAKSKAIDHDEYIAKLKALRDSLKAQTGGKP